MLKVAVIILVIMLAYAAVYSVIALIAPKTVMASAFKAMTAKTLDDAQTDGYLKPLMTGQRNTGVFALATTISGFFVLFAGFQKAQKWAWWAFLVVGGVAWLGGLIICIAIGDTVNMILQLVGIVLLLLGVLLPIKAFFAGAPKQVEEPAQEA